MDRNQRAVMSMQIRRLGDGDKAQYLQHFRESRDITVGEYQEYMDDSERKLDILRNTPFTEVGMSVHEDVMNGLHGPGICWSAAEGGILDEKR